MISKQQRIQITGDIFGRFQKQGLRFSSQHLSALVLSANDKQTRFAVLVPKKLDKRSSRRNKVRRSVFRVLHRFYPKLTSGKQMLIQVHSMSVEDEEVEQILTKAKLLINE